MIELVKRCPNCDEERPPDEVMCDALKEGERCGWALLDVPLTRKGVHGRIPPKPVSAQPTLTANSPVPFSRCANGHEIRPGDLICPTCGIADGEDPVSQAATEHAVNAMPTAIDHWTVLAELPFEQGLRRLHVCSDTISSALLTLFPVGSEPDTKIFETLQRQPHEHVEHIHSIGQWQGQTYCVSEKIEGGNLSDFLHATPATHDSIAQVLREVGSALASFSAIGLRHRAIRPDNLLVRSVQPLDLVVTSFGSARLSDLDLDTAAPLQVSRYSAPEVIVGAVSAASDWWSLGIILLEYLVGPTFKREVNDQAFMLSVVTRGVALPRDLSSRLDLLLRGLLARDPNERWQWKELTGWLDGEDIAAPAVTTDSSQQSTLPLRLGERDYYRADAFALAAAEATNWELGRELFQRGVVHTWAEQSRIPPETLAALRRLSSAPSIADDHRQGLLLMALNANLPLTLRGQIVTPNWLVNNAVEAYELITGPAMIFLRAHDSTRWLTQIADRVNRIVERAKALEISLDDERFRVMSLATSRPRLDAIWNERRGETPDSDHPGLASLLGRATLGDDDLILILSASLHQFEPREAILDRAAKLASTCGLAAFDPIAATPWLYRSRLELYAELEKRTAGFARCGNQVIDEWADQLRVQRRLSLQRALVLLAIPASDWQEPARQQYVENLLDFFEKRASSVAQRGPLVRLIIGKTTPRVDLHEIGSPRASSGSIVDRIIARSGEHIHLDPTALLSQPAVTDRMRRLQNHAAMYRRDTGVDGLYMGFPFLIVRTPGNIRPRIMPLVLWPVRIGLEIGSRSSGTVSFDTERSEVRLNPAIASLLGLDEAKRWRELLDEALQRAALSTTQIMDVLGSFVPARERSLQQLPGKDYVPTNTNRELVCSAVLFHAEFMGQAIAEDLRALRRKPLEGTALLAAIKAGASTKDVTRENADQPERLHYSVTDSDPSQDHAVVRSRRAPGLLIEGPPGTGKSQTIVNVVSDCIGRGESVLIVCQKQAAIQVVSKRLEAESIGERIFVVSDVGSDRQHIINKLRDQLENARNAAIGESDSLRASQKSVAEQVVRIEKDIDDHHNAYYRVDPTLGLSYRNVLAELIAIDHAGHAIDAPRLRDLLETVKREELSEIQDAIEPVANTWLHSRYENSPLSATKQFASDTSISEEFRRDFMAHATKEAARSKVLAATVEAFDITELSSHAQWLASNHVKLANLTESIHKQLADWYEKFAVELNGQSEASLAISGLQQAREATQSLARSAKPSPHIAQHLVTLSTESCVGLLSDLQRILQPRSVLSRINPARLTAWLRVRNFLRSITADYSRTGIEELNRTLALELELRTSRSEVHEWQRRFAMHSSADQLVFAHEIERAADQLVAKLKPLVPLAGAIRTCPLAEDAEAAIRSAQPDELRRFLSRYQGALIRFRAKVDSLASLQLLKRWFSEAWILNQSECINSNRVLGRELRAIAESIPTIAAYQSFRRQASALPERALELLRSLRAYESSLSSIEPSHLNRAIRTTLAREAYLVWKHRIEAAEPALLLDRDMLKARVERLEQLDEQLRVLNRRLLSSDSGLTEAPRREPWEAVTRLTGRRARRLRELFEEALPLGLLKLRPVWLMNPDVASRILPLRAGLFDVVIFDEASQIPVEHALPTLYRARRAIVSGDEKQMPPTSFFATRVESDEDELFDPDELDSAVTESERATMEENLSRRDIKDCEDLLTLARSFLPDAMLKIHYRSNFRELIAFSNSAFYGGNLFVPVQNTESEIRRASPISVKRVSGIYKNQTNSVEAKAIVDVLADLWRGDLNQRPSVGVVTFNRKQADLIEEMIEDRAESDPAFREALGTETERKQHGEDMGFFVKNVENVQGDERDIIVFSTTFGRDEGASFRRFFGVLGQHGGERRLNVAVTRARDRVVLVTSMPVGEISDMLATGRAPAIARDYLQAYLDYAIKVSDGDFKSAASVAARCQRGVTAKTSAPNTRDDAFLHAVEAFLRSLNVPIQSQRLDDEVFGLDFALASATTGRYALGIECDAPRHSLLSRARAREIWRRRVLKRSVPTVHRVSSHAWYHDAARERERLENAVKAALADNS